MSASWCPSLIIDQEFKSWIPPLTQLEREALEESIIKDGCRDPIVIWDETIIDGHNRYEICTRLKIYFKVFKRTFSSREEAKNWIVNNQLSRRNLTPEQRDYLIGKLYKEQKREQGGTGANQHKEQRDQNDPSALTPAPAKTSERIATQFKVSPATVKRAEKFTDAVDTIAANHGAEIKDKILSRELDISKEQVQVLIKKPIPEQKAIISKIETGQAEDFKQADILRTRERQQEKVAAIVAKSQPLDGSLGKFNLILLDPPWKYNDRCPHSDTRFGGGVHGQYPTMEFEEIMALKIPEIAADDCILLLWVTWPFLREGLQLIDHWGFTYKTAAFDWMKQNKNGEGIKFGNGHYMKSNTEPCLLASKGECLTPAANTESMAILAPIREHSRKPDEIYPRIESMYPTLRKIELFARQPRPGWHVWGNQSDGSIFNK